MIKNVSKPKTETENIIQVKKAFQNTSYLKFL